MCTRFKIRVGDLLPALIAEATYCDPTDGQEKSIDWTQWTALTFTMRGPRTVSGAADGDALGTIFYTWQAGDTRTPGAYRGTFHGTSPTGKPQTFPTSGYLEIVIDPAP